MTYDATPGCKHIWGCKCQRPSTAWGLWRGTRTGISWQQQTQWTGCTSAAHQVLAHPQAAAAMLRLCSAGWRCTMSCSSRQALASAQSEQPGGHSHCRAHRTRNDAQPGATSRGDWECIARHPKDTPGMCFVCMCCKGAVSANGLRQCHR